MEQESQPVPVVEQPLDTARPLRAASPKTPRLLLLCVVIVWVCCIVTGLFYWHRHEHMATSSAKGPALSMYYSDGTLLWQSPESLSESQAPTFVAYVQQQLQAMYGNNYLKRGSWRVTTTLNKTLEDVAEGEVQVQQSTLAKDGVSEGAFAAENVTNGQVVSWVGSLTPGHSTTDNLTNPANVMQLQLPFTYAALLQNTSDTTNTVFDDAQGPLPGWPCTNKVPLNSPGGQDDNCLWDKDGEYLGPLTVYQALAKARNVPAVEAIEAMGGGGVNDYLPGVNKVVATTNSMGSDAACYEAGTVTYIKKNETQCYPAAAIGNGFMATPKSTIMAYATLADNGVKVPQAVILQAVLNGKTQYRWTLPNGIQTISKSIAQPITASLSDTSATALQADKSMYMTPDGAKTAISFAGSSADNQDNMTSGTVQYSSKYVAGFFVSGQKTIFQNPGDPSSQEEVGTLNGSIANDTIPVTYDWMSAAQ